MADRKARMISRNGLDWTARFRRIAEAASFLADKAILDGEVVIFRQDGTTDFNALPNCVEGKPAPISYVLYDIPHCGGYDLTRTPLIERKRLLENLSGIHKGAGIVEKVQWSAARPHGWWAPVTYAGRVGTGFTDRALATIGTRLEGIRKQEPTFRKLPDLVRGEEVFWVKPELVAEVNYCSWTKDGLLRHTSFKGIREDREPRR